MLLPPVGLAYDWKHGLRGTTKGSDMADLHFFLGYCAVLCARISRVKPLGGQVDIS